MTKPTTDFASMSKADPSCCTNAEPEYDISHLSFEQKAAVVDIYLDHLWAMADIERWWPEKDVEEG